MANILSGQPAVDATTSAAAGNRPSFRITPDTYTTIDSLVKTTKDHVPSQTWSKPTAIKVSLAS